MHEEVERAGVRYAALKDFVSEFHSRWGLSWDTGCLGVEKAIEDGALHDEVVLQPFSTRARLPRHPMHCNIHMKSEDVGRT